MSLADYDSLAETKSNWLCVMCHSKDRRSDNNSETPLRTAQLGQQHLAIQSRKDSNCLSAKSIRDITREELQITLTQQFKRQLLEVRSAVMSLESSMTSMLHQKKSSPTALHRLKCCKSSEGRMNPCELTTRHCLRKSLNWTNFPAQQI
ncbi:unnamed protein product [Pieris brassicae]|uniref:Uncharacterized protein n=1 Tax=Pieris brassicae TaxID=7116 RepID=A0A9P0XBK2_PIEBR|nr:unnamed protein product [Pieris brassicae]